MRSEMSGIRTPVSCSNHEWKAAILTTGSTSLEPREHSVESAVDRALGRASGAGPRRMRCKSVRLRSMSGVSDVLLHCCRYRIQGIRLGIKGDWRLRMQIPAGLWHFAQLRHDTAGGFHSG